MSHLIPMNLQLNAEVRDKRGGQRGYCSQLLRGGGWSPGEMASLQHEWASVSWGAWGEQGAGIWPFVLLCWTQPQRPA